MTGHRARAVRGRRAPVQHQRGHAEVEEILRNG